MAEGGAALAMHLTALFCHVIKQQVLGPQHMIMVERSVLASGKENPIVLAEVRSHPLAYLVGGPPVAVVVLELVWLYDFLRRLEDEVEGDLAAIDPPLSRLSRCLHLGELDVQPHQLVLARDDHERA